MTLIAAWLRKTSSDDQLMVASDSRLSFGARWDCCPKIFPLARNDSILAFCGDTSFAYPVLLQLVNAIGNYGKALSRELDITELRPHFIKVIESMLGQVVGPSKAIDQTGFKILFAGYSSKHSAFQAWALYFDKTAKKFTHRKLAFHKKRTNGTKPFLFIGDNTNEAANRLYSMLREREKLTTGNLEMEPLEVLTEMIESPQYDTICGPPQLVKIYKHINVLPINVLWPRKAPLFVAHFGRPLLGYEGSKYACLDLNDLSLLSPQQVYERLTIGSPSPTDPSPKTPRQVKDGP